MATCGWGRVARSCESLLFCTNHWPHNKALEALLDYINNYHCIQSYFLFLWQATSGSIFLSELHRHFNQLFVKITRSFSKKLMLVSTCWICSACNPFHQLPVTFKLLQCCPSLCLIRSFSSFSKTLTFYLQWTQFCVHSTSTKDVDGAATKKYETTHRSMEESRPAAHKCVRYLPVWFF